MLKLSRMPSGEPEIFASIQGEGASAGTPSVFVRLSLCNLRCTWCDTAYTWDWERYDPKVEIVSLATEEIVARVEQMEARNVVITGGEPLLQQGELMPLVETLKARGYRLEIETNGTTAPQPELASCIDQWNVSPKLANSRNSEEKRAVPTSLAWFAGQPNAYFKLVVAETGDLAEVDALIGRYGVPSSRVLLMAEGRAPAIQLERSRWLVAACQERGYRYTPRLHVLLWGDERGR
ncbi:MAG: 7-carboxy-7-deazaguanine synthase QueE [Chloroflexota bacterium]